MTQQEHEQFIEGLYEMGLSDSEVEQELANLEPHTNQPATPARKPQAASGGADLFSAKTLFPAAVAAVQAGPAPGDSAMAQGQLERQQAAPIASQMVPGLMAGGAGMPAPIVTQQGMQAGLGAVSDWTGKVFRLAGSLIPTEFTRGTVPDPATGQPRMRTLTEALQNPNASVATAAHESIDQQHLPGPVKAAEHLGLGVVEGLVAGGPIGAVKTTVKNLLAKGAVKAGVTDAAEGGAKFLQNARMKTTASDINKGASAGNAMKHGLGNLSLEEGAQVAAQKVKDWSAAREAIYQSKPDREISASSAIKQIEERITEKAFGREEKLAALAEIRQELDAFVQRNAGAVMEREGFVPRRPISQLSQADIQDLLKKGEIRFSGKKNGALGFEYTKPEVPPETFAPKRGVYLNLKEADDFKQWLQDAGAKFGKKAPRESSVSEQIFKDMYGLITERAETYGGAKYATLNRNLSEVIPIRNVLERTLKREELGSDVVTKGGLLKTGFNAAATATGANRFGATAAYGAAQAAKEEAAVPLWDAAVEGFKSGFVPGMLRGSLNQASR